MQHDYDAFPLRHVARDLAAAFPGKAEIIVHNGLDLLVPTFGLDQAQRLEPKPRSHPVRSSLSHSPVLRDLDTPWNIAKHREARQPVVLGSLTTGEARAFTQTVQPYVGHVLDMPIKFPGTNVRIPGELASFVPVIQRIIDLERGLNPSYDAYYAYLSIHQGLVNPGERQRETPYHVDGFQGPRWTHKHPANHSYMVSDALPTMFYPVGFPLDDIDPNFDDVYAEFARRIDDDPTVAVWMPKPLELILMDCYCVHRGQRAPQPTFRTWLRISWETRIFDRLGNAHNPLFDYAWDMVARDTDPRIRPRVLMSAA